MTREAWRYPVQYNDDTQINPPPHPEDPIRESSDDDPVSGEIAPEDEISEEFDSGTADYVPGAATVRMAEEGMPDDPFDLD